MAKKGELVQLCDRKGNPTGSMSRKKAHRNGFLHWQVRVLIFNKKGEVFIQQRAPTKDVDPLLWEGSVSGHVGPGEDLVKAAIRETEEEAGLKISNLKLIGETIVTEHTEKNYMYIYMVKNITAPTKIDEKEVLQGNWEDPKFISKDIKKNPQKYTPSFRKAWKMTSSKA
jgi:isopentenyldiphosphate isomerase